MIEEKIVKEEFDNLEGFIKKAKKEERTPEAHRYRTEEQMKYCFQRLVEKGAELILLNEGFSEDRYILISPDGRSIKKITRRFPENPSYQFYRKSKTKKIIIEGLSGYSKIIGKFSGRQSQLFGALEKID